MKGDNTSKFSDKSNQRTIICSEEPIGFQPIMKNGIRLKYSDNTFSHYDISTLSCINPIFFARLMNQADKDIILPSYITPSLLMEFLFIVKNGFNDLDDSGKDNAHQILALIQVSDFFQNESITIQLIRDIVMTRLNADNAFGYLQYSYEKLNKICTESLESEAVWFDLFYKCLEIIGVQPFLLLKHNDIIAKLDSKVLYELLQKCFAHLILGNYILVENDTTTNSIDSDMSNEIEGENYFESINETSPKPNQHLQDLHKKKSINNKDKLTPANENVVLISLPNQSIASKTNFTTLKRLEELIQFLYKVHQCSNNNFFSLITYEYMSIFSNNSLRELSESPNPTFEIQIPYNFDAYFYEEYFIDLTINNKRVIIVIYYQQNDDSLNVSIKIGEKAQSDQRFCFQIFTFISIIKLNEDFTLPNSVQTNLTSLSNNKSMHCVFKFPNFKARFKHKVDHDNKTCIVPPSKKYFINHDGVINHNPVSSSIDEEDYYYDDDNEGYDYEMKYFTLRIYLKLSFIHSVLASFLLQNFSALAYQPDINKLSKQLFMLVIKNRYLNKKSEDDILNALVLWLDDEINIKEDITEVLDVIQWKNVTEEILFVFIMKYAHMITIEQYEEKIVKALEEKHSTPSPSPSASPWPLRQVLLSVFYAAKRIDYNSLYTKMNKEIKMNLAYNPNNTHNTCKSNIGTRDMTSGLSNEKKLTSSQHNEISSSKNIISNLNHNNSNTSANNNKNRLPEHLNQLYHSKEVNTINKFIISNDQRNKRNKSSRGINGQIVSVQTTSLTQFLDSHTQKKSKTHMKYFSIQGSAKTNTGKKISHLKDYSLQIQTEGLNGYNTNKNIINLRTATNSKHNNHGDGDDSGNTNINGKKTNEKSNSRSLSKNDSNKNNTRNGKVNKELKRNNNTVNTTVIEQHQHQHKDKDKDKERDNSKDGQTNSDKRQKKINYFLKPKSTALIKKYQRMPGE